MIQRNVFQRRKTVHECAKRPVIWRTWFRSFTSRGSEKSKHRNDYGLRHDFPDVLLTISSGWYLQLQVILSLSGVLYLLVSHEFWKPKFLLCRSSYSITAIFERLTTSLFVESCSTKQISP